jgi:hypothetical protein
MIYDRVASSQKQQIAGRHIAPPRHISLISRQSGFVLTQLSATCLSEKQQIPILQSLVLTRQELQPTFHLTRGEFAALVSTYIYGNTYSLNSQIRALAIYTKSTKISIPRMIMNSQ